MSETGWHVDKRVSVGHIVTTLTVAVAVVIWIVRVEGHVALNAQSIAALEKRLERADERYAGMFREIKETLVRIERKLDSKADR